MTRARMGLGLLLVAAAFGGRASLCGQELHLFSVRQLEPRLGDVSTDTASRTLDPSPSWNLSESGSFALGIEGPAGIGSDASQGEPASFESLDLPEAVPTRPPQKRCVLFQCETLPIAPAKKLFTTGVTLWTIAGVLGGIADGIEGPLHYKTHPFTFTDESYFQYWTYGGGSDKASHFVISANAAGLLYDAYRLNGLSEAQSFGLALGTSVVAGAMVEIGDGLTPYGFSAQDWTADALGSLAGVLVKRYHLDDTIGFQLGRWLGTTIPPVIVGGRPLFGIDYTQEIYTMDVKFAGALPRLGARPGFARFFQFSFAYLSKGFAYQPQLDSRYQEIGLEIGLDFQEILKAVGVDDSTWWGDTLQRIAGFLRIPYTQVGAYYNLKNNKWYGPSAPYHYY
jgi:hypothetical protein